MNAISTLARVRLAAALVMTLAGAAATAAPIHFDFSQANSLTSNANVHFANAVYADIVNATFDVIGQHWIADTDPSTPALTIEAMSAYGHNGSAAAGVTGLQALFQSVLVQFDVPFTLGSLTLRQDDSSLGFAGMTSMVFLDANGQQIGASVDYLQNAVSTITAGPLSGNISAILLSSGKFYRDLDITATEVPEPGSMGLLLAGVGVMALAARRRRTV